MKKYLLLFSALFLVGTAWGAYSINSTSIPEKESDSSVSHLEFNAITSALDAISNDGSTFEMSGTIKASQFCIGADCIDTSWPTGGTTYTAGVGIDLTGDAISIDDTGCVADQILKWNGVDDWACAADDDTIATTTTCADGQVLKWNNTGSAWECGDDDSATPGTDTLADLTCAADEIAKYIGGVWTCAADADTDTTYTAGTGIAIAGGVISLQADGGAACADGQILKWNNTGSVWVCADNIDTNSDTLAKLSPDCMDTQIAQFSGGAWSCAAMTLTEEDPEVGTLTEGKWCIAAGGKVDCIQDAPTDFWTDGTEEIYFSDGVKNVGIKTENASADLSVKGKILAKELCVADDDADITGGAEATDKNAGIRCIDNAKFEAFLAAFGDPAGGSGADFDLAFISPGVVQVSWTALTCNASAAGTLRFGQSSTEGQVLQICMANNVGTYGWYTIINSSGIPGGAQQETTGTMSSL
ncbi:MAG: hypothetical protein K9M51_00960 [Candidatus Gracilibacteria bacterium]|nr:hypothetical protein [Candidatus Gracilibacteria bacterium]